MNTNTIAYKKTELCSRDNHNCQHYVPNYDIAFKLLEYKQGDQYSGRKFNNHSLVFLLEGDVEFSYNDYLNRRFSKGDLFFIPQAAEMYGIALTDIKMLILSFNNRIKSLCDKCRLHEYQKYIQEIDYDFRPLKITPTLYTFIDLIKQYIGKEIQCSYLHELKQQELFVLLGAEFTERELVELFYPISGGNIDFRSRVIEHYRNDLEVSELSQKFGMSYSSFLRRFKKEFGEPAQEWMLKQKAKHIKLRLSIPSTTLSDIIREFDFSDSSHLTRFSRKYYGCTPTELIKVLRNTKTTNI